jgi:hypothetical protein
MCFSVPIGKPFRKKTISVRDGLQYSSEGKEGIATIENRWTYGWDLKSMTGRTEEEIRGYSICSTPYVDLHFVRDLSNPIIAKLAVLEKELEKANIKANDFKFPTFVHAPNEPRKSDFFFGIGYKKAYETY